MCPRVQLSECHFGSSCQWGKVGNIPRFFFEFPSIFLVSIFSCYWRSKMEFCNFSRAPESQFVTSGYLSTHIEGNLWAQGHEECVISIGVAKKCEAYFRIYSPYIEPKKTPSQRLIECINKKSAVVFDWLHDDWPCSSAHL